MKMQLLLCTAKIKCQLTHQCSFTLCFCFGGVLIYKNYCYCPEYVPQFFTRVESLLPTLSVDICFKQLISKSYVCLICMTYDVCLSQLLEESHDNFPQLDRFYKETAIKIQQREREVDTQSCWKLSTTPSPSLSLFPILPLSYFITSSDDPQSARDVRQNLRGKDFFSLSFRPLTVMIQFTLQSKVEKRRAWAYPVSP